MVQVTTCTQLPNNLSEVIYRLFVQQIFGLAQAMPLIGQTQG